MTGKAQTTETIEATVERIVFHNPSNGWTVVRAQTDDSPLLTTIVGSFQSLSPGERVRFTGKWTIDRKHGRQFAADTCLPLAPATLKGIEKFLGSGLIPGVGPVMAGRIVTHFGIQTLEIIENTNRLSEISGIGSKRASAIKTALMANRSIKEVMIFLESAGISPTYAHRVFKRYGNDAIRQVSENPYNLASDIHGIGFLSADKIAAHLGIPQDSPKRAEAGLLYALEDFASEGHVFAPQQRLLEYAEELLDIDTTHLERAVDRLILMGQIRRQGSGSSAAIYLPRLYQAEETAAKTLVALLNEPAKKLPIDTAVAVAIAEKKSAIELAPEQKHAFAALGQSKVMVLTGGPGTGKTTLLSGLTSCLGELKLNIALAAPTGRAARRMAEATGRDARTLHRLLEFTPKTMRFERNKSRPLDADMVIVDEVSMVDAEMFAALLSAIKPKARLLLVGDPNQLPSVGPGRVLADLLTLSTLSHSRLAPIRLTRIFRQAKSSLIVTGAHDVLAGRSPRTGEKGSHADLFLIERNEPEACVDTIKELLVSRIPKRFGFDSVEQVQVLTPMHKGLLGATNLNHELQELLNPAAPASADSVAVFQGGNRFRTGDKVMQIRNNYDLEVFNGDIGKVTAIGRDPGWVEVRFPDRTARYPDNEVDQLTLAYACSVHKSQGSEYPAVVMPLHTQHFVMLQRNLLYTAITRGKRLVVIVGSKRALRIAVKNSTQTNRNSGLVERARQLLRT